MEIQILGETLTIEHNTRVQIAYEQMTGKAFNLEAIAQKTELRIALYMATIVACNPDTKITMDMLLDAKSISTIIAIDKAVNNAIREWYMIPETTNDPALKPDGEASGTEAQKKKSDSPRAVRTTRRRNRHRRRAVLPDEAVGDSRHHPRISEATP